ncbi:MAG: amidohydrolase family protein [Spirochaetia bacterium]|nr:amidohydrolase family protein [Spirochaetia bacterium]
MPGIEIRAPDDFHAHLRQGAPLAAFARRHAAGFARVAPMPNTLPPLATPAALVDYVASIERAAPGLAVIPVFKLMPGMDENDVRALAEAGARIGKYYPAGSTTNSGDGIRDPAEVDEALGAMRELGLALAVHAEEPSAPILERETAFLPVLDRIVRAHPGLRLSVEHLSGAAAVRWVEEAPETVGATITAHHLCFTLEDLLGESLDTALYCKPLPKSGADRAELRRAACSGSRKFFFGSDSAPHEPARKAAGAAGVYAAPVALALLAGCFEEEGALDGLEGFIAVHGAAFHGLEPNRGSVRLWREDWTVPEAVDGVRPLAAGRTLRWKAARSA